MTPEQAQARITELRSDSAFTARYLQKEAGAVAEMGRLFPMAFPEPQASPESPGAPAPPQQADPNNPLAYGAQSPAEYRFDIPAGVQLDPELESATRALFHQAGIPAAVGNWVGSLWNQAVAKGLPSEDQKAADHAQCGATLQKMWGGDFDRNLEAARGEVARIARIDPSIIKKLEVSGLGNHPYLIATLANLAAARQERGRR